MRSEKNAVDRFMALALPVTESGCWLWTGRCNNNGYGFFFKNSENRVMLAHRFSYETFIGTIPPGLHVLHKCDVSSCVNPNHLSIGSQSENIQQCMDRNRHHRNIGVLNGHAKLSPAEIEKIISDNRTVREIARDYGVHNSTICRVKTNKSWGTAMAAEYRAKAGRKE